MREAACLCTESGLRCRFLSGEANLGRLGNNLVTAVEVAGGGGWMTVGGVGFRPFRCGENTLDTSFLSS